MDFLHFIAEQRFPAADIFFQAVTYAAQELLVVAVICWFFWCGRKSLAYQLGFSYFLSGLTVQGLKIFFRIPRPWVLDSGFEPVKSAVPGATGYSFPSGHTQSATALFTTLAFHFKRRGIRFLCVLAFLLVGFSRMYLGVHTPKDVLTAMGVTIILSWLVCIIWKKLEYDKSRDLLISLILAAAAMILLACDVSLVSAGLLTTANALDCCKACGAGLAFAAGFYIERRFLDFTSPSSFRQKLIRFLIGIIGAAVIEFGLKALLPVQLITAFFRYFLIVSWILVFYPMLFTRFPLGKRKSA